MEETEYWAARVASERRHEPIDGAGGLYRHLGRALRKAQPQQARGTVRRSGLSFMVDRRPGIALALFASRSRITVKEDREGLGPFLSVGMQYYPNRVNDLHGMQQAKRDPAPYPRTSCP